MADGTAQYHQHHYRKTSKATLTIDRRGLAGSKRAGLGHGTCGRSLVKRSARGGHRPTFGCRALLRGGGSVSDLRVRLRPVFLLFLFLIIGLIERVWETGAGGFWFLFLRLLFSLRPAALILSQSVRLRRGRRRTVFLDLSVSWTRPRARGGCARRAAQVRAAVLSGGRASGKVVSADQGAGVAQQFVGARQ